MLMLQYHVYLIQRHINLMISHHVTIISPFLSSVFPSFPPLDLLASIKKHIRSCIS